MRRLPSFSALRAFESAARYGSFKDGAKAINVSPSAISHQVRALERDLGKKLFRRNGSQVILTEDAKVFLNSIETAFNLLEQGAYKFKGSKITNTLVISLLSTLSTLWLIPKLDGFFKLHPEVDIEILDDMALCDFSKSDTDLAIRYDFYGNGSWSGLVSVPLIEEYIYPVCSPEFWENHPEAREFFSIPNSALLVNKRHPDEWVEWFEAVDQEFDAHAHHDYIVLDTSNMTLMGAKNGLGIALGRTPFVNHFLKNQDLIKIHSKFQYRGFRHYLVCPEDQSENPNIVKFRDWILATVEQDKETEGY